MQPIPIDGKSLEVITAAGKEAVSFVITKTTGDDHPEYEKAIVEGTSQTIKELAAADTSNATRIYEALKIKREQRDFWNFSAVLKKFASLVKAKPSNKVSDDNDVFWGLLEHAKDVSNEEVQELIAKIIAGEYNAPGTYSMSTLQTLKTLGKADLERLNFFSGFYLSGWGFVEDFFGMSKRELDLRVKLEIDFSGFLELQNLGLVQSNTHTVAVTYKKGDKIMLGSLVAEAEKDFEKWNFPSCWELTTAGKQIMQHLDSKLSDDFISWLKEYFGTRGIKITMPETHPQAIQLSVKI